MIFEIDKELKVNVEIRLSPKVEKYIKKIQTNELSEEKIEYKRICKTINILKENPSKGKAIQRGRLNKKHLKRFETDKLFVIEVDNLHRLIYSLKGTSKEEKLVVEIHAIWNHKEYDRFFKY